MLKADKGDEPTTQKFMTRRRPRPRGVAGRMTGLAWIRNNSREGVVYFGDDDNSYDLRLFEEVTYF
jgi:beta-1,3-glucuronyltransferase